MKYQSSSANQTKQIAKALAKNLSSNVFALTGDLGAGKTVFVQGFAEGLGIKDKIISPTFVLQRIHKIPPSKGSTYSKKILHHIDLYRISEFNQLGLDELFNDSNNIVLIEWAEKLNLPKNVVRINIEKISEDKRLIIID